MSPKTRANAASPYPGQQTAPAVLRRRRRAPQPQKLKLDAVLRTSSNAPSSVPKSELEISRFRVGVGLACTKLLCPHCTEAAIPHGPDTAASTDAAAA